MGNNRWPACTQNCLLKTNAENQKLRNPSSSRSCPSVPCAVSNCLLSCVSTEAQEKYKSKTMRTLHLHAPVPLSTPRVHNCLLSSVPRKKESISKTLSDLSAVAQLCPTAISESLARPDLNLGFWSRRHTPDQKRSCTHMSRINKNRRCCHSRNV